MESLLNEYHENYQQFGYFHPQTIHSGYLLSKSYDEREELGQSPQYIILTFIGALCSDFIPSDELYKSEEKIEEGDNSQASSSFPTISILDIFLLYQKAFEIPSMENSDIPSLSYLRYHDLEGLLNFWNYSDSDSIPHSNALRSLIKLFDQKIITTISRLKNPLLQGRVLQVFATLLEYTDKLDRSLQLYQQSIDLLQSVSSEYEGNPFFQLLLSDSYHGMGVVLTHMTKFTEAEEKLSNSLEIIKSLQQYDFHTDIHLLPMSLLQVTAHLGDLFFSSSQHVFTQWSTQPSDALNRGSSGWSNVEKCYEFSIGLCHQYMNQTNDNDSTSSLILKFRCKYFSKYLGGRLGITLQRQAAVLIQDSCDLMQSMNHTNSSELSPRLNHLFCHDLTLEELKSKYLRQAVIHTFSMDFLSEEEMQLPANNFTANDPALHPSSKSEMISQLMNWGCYSEALSLVQSEIESKHTNYLEDDQFHVEVNISPETADLIMMESELLRILSNLPLACERYELSIKLYTSLQRIVPDTVRALCGLAKCYQAEGEFQTALKIFRKSISLLLKKDSQSAVASWLPEFREGDATLERYLLLCDLVSDLCLLCCDQGYYQQAFYLGSILERIHQFLLERKYIIPDIKLLEREHLHCRVLLLNDRFADAKELVSQVLTKYKLYYQNLEQESYLETKKYRHVHKMKSHVKIADCILLQGMVEFHHGEIVVAHELFMSSMNIYKLYYPKLSNLSLLPIIEYIANCNVVLGYYNRADIEYHQVIKIFTHLTNGSRNSTSSPVVGRALYGLGVLKFQMGMYCDALEYFQRSIEIMERSLGQYHPQYLDLLLALARCHLLLGNTDTSKELYNNFSTLRNTPTSLSLTPMNKGNDDRMSNKLFGHIFSKVKEFHAFTSLLPEISANLPISSFSSLDGLFCYHTAQRHLFYGEYSQALKLFETSIQIFQNVFHKKHRFLSNILYCEGLTHLSSGMDYKAAVRVIKKCLQVRKTAYGEETLPVAESLYLQGRLECDKGDYFMSEESLLKSQEILLKCYGTNCLHVAKVKDALGRLYTLLSRYDEARSAITESLAIQHELTVVEDNHENDVSEEENIADEKEEEHKDRGEDEKSEYEGPDQGDTYTLLCELNLTQHNWDEAEVNCLKSIDIYQKYYSPKHPKLLNSRGNLGLIYLLSKKRCKDGTRDYALEGEKLVDESLRYLLYQSDTVKEKPCYHSYQHPWIKKFQLRYCLPASNPPSARDREPFHTPRKDARRNSNSTPQMAMNDQAIESNLLFENYQLRSKNDELQRMVTSLQSQLQLLEQRLQNAEDLNKTSQEMIKALKSTSKQRSNPPLSSLSSTNSSYLTPKKSAPVTTTEEREGIPTGTADEDEDDDEDSQEYFPKIGTIAKTLGYAKKTFTPQRKYQSGRK